MKLIKILIILVFSLNPILKAKCQWTILNDMDYSVSSINVKDSNVFCSSSQSLFLTTNQGEIWNKVGDFSGHIAFSNSKIYVIDYSYDIDSFVLYSSPLNEINWSSIICAGIGPENGSGWGIHNFIVFNDNLIVGNNNGEVFKSTDEGSNWFSSSIGLVVGYTSFCNQSNGVYDMATAGEDIYLGSNCYGIYKSTNGGDTWIPTNEGLPIETPFKVYDIAFSNSKVLIATENGLYSSIDEGMNWNLVEGLNVGSWGISWLDAKNSITALSTSNTEVRYSLNEGNDWYLLNDEELEIAVDNPTIALANDSNLYISGYSQGIIRADLGNNAIKRASYGLNKSNTIKLLKQGNNLYAATKGGGIYYSGNNGENWNIISNELVGKYIKDMVVYNDVIYAGSDKGMFYSLDSAITWQMFAPIENIHSLVANNDFIVIATHNKIYKLDLNSSEIDTVYNQSNQNIINTLYLMNNNLLVGTNDGIIYSDFDQISWNDASITSNFNVNTITDYNDSIIFGTNNSVYKIDTEFSSISEINNGLPATKVNNLSVNDTILLAATNDGIYDYYNGSWVFDFIEHKSFHILVSDSTIYAGTYKGIYKRPRNFIPTSINEVKLDISYEVYPNPFTDRINIAFNDFVPENLNIHIYNASGVCVFNKRIYQVNNTVEILLDDLSKGMYFIQIEIENSILYGKVIIKG